MKKMKRKGFTLIELMIVISIIGVLAAIAIPNFRSAREKSNQRACYANQKTVLGALEMYNLDNGDNTTISKLGGFAELVKGKYMQSAPDDPGCKSATSDPAQGSSNYQSNEDGDVWCAFHGTVDGKCIGTGCVPDGAAQCGGGS